MLRKWARLFYVKLAVLQFRRQFWVVKRLIEEELLSWKDSGHRKPLVLRGARQVGKTWLVERFLAPLFENFVKIDFEKRRDLRAIFDENLDPARILSARSHKSTIARNPIDPILDVQTDWRWP
jgi:predicted AAA+ superfamily ATPase